ncbi:uncharacterized protein LOC144579631 [Callithrix jacchus]
MEEPIVPGTLHPEGEHALHSRFRHNGSLIQQKSHRPVFTPNYSALLSLPLKLPLASLMNDSCSPQVPKSFFTGSKETAQILERSLCSPYRCGTAEKRQSCCCMQDAQGPPASRGFAGREGAGPGRDGAAPIAAPGAGRGGGGTAATASAVVARRGASLAKALTRPRLPAAPWRRPRGAPRPSSPAGRKGSGTCRLHAPRGSSSSRDLSPSLAAESPWAAPPPAVSSETFPRWAPSPQHPFPGLQPAAAGGAGPGAVELQARVPNPTREQRKARQNNSPPGNNRDPGDPPPPREAVPFGQQQIHTSLGQCSQGKGPAAILAVSQPSLVTSPGSGKSEVTRDYSGP